MLRWTQAGILRNRGPYQARGPQEPWIIWDPSLFDYVSRKWETHPLSEAAFPTWRLIFHISPLMWLEVILSCSTSWPMTIHHIVTSTSHREEETGWFSLALGMWTGRSQLFHFSMFASSKILPCVCICGFLNKLYIFKSPHVCLLCALKGCTWVNPYLGKLQTQCPGIKGHEQDRTE